MKLSKAIKEYIAKKLAKKHLQNVCPCCHHKGYSTVPSKSTNSL